MTETQRTTCSRDCPDACGIVATVEKGEVVRLRGDPDHPVTKGYLCFRTSRFLELQNSPGRLRQPLLRRRRSDRLEPVSMDEALDFAANKLTQIREESGPAAIFHYRSGGSLGLLKSIACRFFEGFGPVTIKSGDICSGAGEAAQLLDFGISDSNDLFDLENSRHIYLWGKNPFASNTHLIPVLKRARAKGVRVTLIDPVHHKGVALADRVVKPRPGGDLDLALGVARRLLDTDRLHPDAGDSCDNFAGYCELLRQKDVAGYAAAAGVDVAELDAIADDFGGGSGPTAILVGWGMQRRVQGGAIVRALDALSAVTGNLFRSGGGCSFYFGRRTAFSTINTGAAARYVREPMFGPDVLAATEPPIRAIWVTAGNPVCMLPGAATVDRALAQTEFVVVVDPFLTDTGRRADLVLPVPTLLEDEDLIGSYGHHYLGASRPVVPPPDGVVHEVELFQRLADRVGIGDHLAGSIEDWKERMMERLRDAGVTLSQLERGAVKNPFAKPVLFADGKVHTESGRVNLLVSRDVEVAAAAGPAAGPAAGTGAGTGAADYPLWLFSNSTEKSQASHWAGAGLGEHTWVAVHPDAALGLTAGEIVTVASRLGTVQAELRFDSEQRRDVAIMPKGGHFDRGHSANALIDARPTDLGLGAAYLDCRVALRK